MTERVKLQRTCIACRQGFNKHELNRIVRTPNGEVKLDDTGRLNGRGAYICRDAACLKKALKTRALERALKITLSEEVKNELLQKYGEA